MGFDPNKYLQKKGGFNPNAYLQDKGAAVDSTVPVNAPQQAPSYGEELLSNVPESAGKFLGNIANIVTSPIETAKGIGGLIRDVGVTAAQNPGAFSGLGMAINPGDTPHLSALAEDLANRYGGWDNFTNTLKTDPVGVLGDLSLVLSGGGAALKAASGGGKMAEVGSAIGKAGAMVDPIAGPIGLAKKALPLETASRKLYRSAVKPSTSLSPLEREAIISTGLTEQIHPTQSGYLKLHEKIGDLNKQILALTEDAGSRGVTLNTSSIVSRIDDVADYFKRDIDPKPHLRELENLKKRFIAAHGRTIPIDEAQRIKQTAGSILRKSYGEMKQSLIEGKKALIRGIKEDIVAELPAAQGLNARESNMLRLEPEIEKALNRAENVNLMGIGAPMTGAVFAASSKSPSIGIKAMIARQIMDSPRFKASLGIALDQAKKRGFKKSKVSTAATVGRAIPQTPREPEE